MITVQQTNVHSINSDLPIMYKRIRSDL